MTAEKITTRRFIRYELPEIVRLVNRGEWINVDVETVEGTFFVHMDHISRPEMYGFAQIRPRESFVRADEAWINAHEGGLSGLCYDERLVAALAQMVGPDCPPCPPDGETIPLMSREEARRYMRCRGIPDADGETFRILSDTDCVGADGVPLERGDRARSYLEFMGVVDGIVPRPCEVTRDEEARFAQAANDPEMTWREFLVLLVKMVAAGKLPEEALSDLRSVGAMCDALDRRERQLSDDRGLGECRARKPKGKKNT